MARLPAEAEQTAGFLTYFALTWCLPAIHVTQPPSQAILRPQRARRLDLGRREK